MGSTEEPKLVTTTVHKYDVDQMKALYKAQLMGVGMMAVMHIYFKYTNPLLIQSIIPLKGAFEGNMIKGGGAALTREKIVADIAERFICIADASKRVKTLGTFAVPVEVIPMAMAQVARRLRALGGQPVVREGVVTDNGGLIIDVHGLAISDPAALESEINQWPGVVTVGIFARHRADVCLLGTSDGVKTYNF